MRKNAQGVDRIILAGHGHGGYVAYQSLKMFFPEIHLISEDGKLTSMRRSRDKVISDFMESDARYCVCAGYQKLIDKKIIESKIIINTHPSLLPKYRGLHSVVWAMLNGEREIGFSVHLVNKYMDDGDIIMQYKVLNDGKITSKQIMDKFDNYVLRNLGSIVYKYINGEIQAIPQDKSGATWVNRRNFEDCLLKFDMPNWQLRAFFKALVRPYPLPMIKIRDVLFEITDYEIKDINYCTTLGCVVNVEDERAYIKTLDGILIVSGLTNTNSGKIVSISDVIKIGQRL